MGFAAVSEGKSVRRVAFVNDDKGPELSAVQKENADLQHAIDTIYGMMRRDPQLFALYREKEAIHALKRSILFDDLNDADLRIVAVYMERSELPRGAILQREDERTEAMHVVVDGTVLRTRIIDGVLHQIQTDMCSVSVGGLHLCDGTPSFASAMCTSDCVVLTCTRDRYHALLHDNPHLALQLVSTLSRKLRLAHTHVRTPLLEQQSAPMSLTAGSLAALMEMIYRFAFLAWATPHRVRDLIPTIPLQVLTRGVYIYGLKHMRVIIDQNVDVRVSSHPAALRLSLACAPGLAMSPFSSLLESLHAEKSAQKNSESLYLRARRGFVPRCAREVLFGLGLNQLSDYYEERVPRVVHQTQIRNALGSLSAGITVAYFSHIFHILSTMKMAHGFCSYAELWRILVEQRMVDALPFIRILNEKQRRRVGTISTVLMPRGVLLRGAQISGSFIIINGFIKLL